VLIPIRAIYLPRCFSAEELAILDAPTASPFTMESVSGGSMTQSSRVAANRRNDDAADFVPLRKSKDSVAKKGKFIGLKPMLSQSGDNTSKLHPRK